MPRMIQAIVLAALLSSLPALAQDKLIGKVVPPYPEGISSEMGKCIFDDDTEACQFAISTLNAADGAVIGVLAAKHLDRRIDDQSYWHVLDVQEAPPLGKGQMWAIEECHHRGLLDPAMIGIVTYRDKGGWLETGETVWAIRFDQKTQKLHTISPANVECVLPGS